MPPSFFPASHGEPPPPETGSRLTSFGSLLGASTVAGALATAPALLRLDGRGGACSPFGTWAVLIAAAVLPMSLFVLALRRARVGFLALGRGKDRAPVAMLLAWIGSTFAAFAIVGAVLRARTHHHALAGVTFAITGLVLALVLAFVWTRLAALRRRATTGDLWAIHVTLGIGLFAILAVAGYGLSRESAASLRTLQGVKLVDGLAFAVTALVASGRSFVNRRALALVGPPVAAIVLVLGASSLRACPSLYEALRGQAPGASWVVGLVRSN